MFNQLKNEEKSLNHEQKKSIILSFTDNLEEQKILQEGLDGEHPVLRVLIDEYFEINPKNRGKRYTQRLAILAETARILQKKAA